LSRCGYFALNLDNVKFLRHNLCMAENIKFKPPYHHGALRDTLIDTAVLLLAEKGASSLSLREVAREAGVSHGAPAHHFGDKAGLLTAVAARGHEKLAIRLQQGQTDTTLAKDRLRAAGEAYIRFAIEQPAYFSVMFRHDLIDVTDVEHKSRSARSKDVLRGCIEELLEPAGVPESRIAATEVALWSLVHGFSSLWLAGNLGDITDSKLLSSLIDSTLGSLADEFSMR
jgi:AcrR family transcriptional regulator